MSRFLALLGGCLLVLAPLAVHAQDSSRILDTHVTADFPLSITFHIEAEGTLDIARAEVRFRVDERSCAQTESSGFPDFAPGQRIATDWKWDMRRGGSLPPGATVRYRWRLVDSLGRVTETPEERYVVTDERYSWQTATRGILTLFWYKGDGAFAVALADAAQEALARLETSAGVQPIGQVKLYIYGSAEELRGALVFPQEWTGGVAFPGFNVIAIGIPPGSLEWGRRAMAHELTHVITEQLTFNCFRDIPTWISEGLATYNEDATGEPSPSYAQALEKAVKERNLLSVRGLAGSFPTTQEQAVLAYAESFSLVRYLIDKHGAAKFGSLLAAFRSGNTADGALRQVYEFDQDGLETEWRRHIGAKPPIGAPSPTAPDPFGPAVPTFEPYAFSTPPAEVSSSRIGETAGPTPTPRGAAGGCSGGLPPPQSPASRNGKLVFLPLAPLALAGIALGIRQKKS